MRLLRTDCLDFVPSRLQDGPRNVLSCFMHELAVEISSYPRMAIVLNFLLDHFVKICHSDRRTEL